MPRSGSSAPPLTGERLLVNIAISDASDPAETRQKLIAAAKRLIEQLEREWERTIGQFAARMALEVEYESALTTDKYGYWWGTLESGPYGLAHRAIRYVTKGKGYLGNEMAYALSGRLNGISIAEAPATLRQVAQAAGVPDAEIPASPELLELDLLGQPVRVVVKDGQPTCRIDICDYQRNPATHEPWTPWLKLWTSFPDEGVFLPDGRSVSIQVEFDNIWGDSPIHGSVNIPTLKREIHDELKRRAFQLAKKNHRNGYQYGTDPLSGQPWIVVAGRRLSQSRWSATKAYDCYFPDQESADAAAQEIAAFEAASVS